MRLGWRNARAGAFQGPSSPALEQNFNDLAKFMTWPHFVTTIDAAQAVTTTYSLKTITAASTDDPFQLVRSTDLISVPRTFDTWMFVGFASAIIANAGVGRYLLGWQLDGATINDALGEVHAAHALGVRVQAPIMIPVGAGQTLNVAAGAPGATTVGSGRANGYFLPLA